MVNLSTYVWLNSILVSRRGSDENYPCQLEGVEGTQKEKAEQAGEELSLQLEQGRIVDDSQGVLEKKKIRPKHGIRQSKWH